MSPEAGVLHNPEALLTGHSEEALDLLDHRQAHPDRAAWPKPAEAAFAPAGRIMKI